MSWPKNQLVLLQMTVPSLVLATHKRSVVQPGGLTSTVLQQHHTALYQRLLQLPRRAILI